MAVKLKGRRSLVRSLAFLARGLNIEQAALELRRRYHPEANVAEVRKAYFPTRPIPIAQQQGKTREKIVQTLEKLKANAQRASEKMRRLHADPTFAKANAERMRRLHADPAFRQKLLEGLNRFWNAYRAKKQGALEQMGFGKAGFDYTGRVAVTVVTPEELAAANEQHLAITSAVSSLPSLWQAVVASEFQLDHPVSSNYARKAADLNPEKRSKILQNAINALRKTRELKKIKPQNS